MTKDKANPLSGDTPLHLATERGHLDIVTCLVDNGAEKNVLNHFGKTPISRAFKYSHTAYTNIVSGSFGAILAYFKTLGLTVPVMSMKLHMTPDGSTKRIQPQPNLLQPETGLLISDDVVEVYGETIGGFYQFVDGRGYTLAVNTGTIWIPLSSSDATLSRHMTLSGITGGQAKALNGEYKPTGEMYGGVTMYCKVDNNDQWLVFEASRKRWRFCRTENKFKMASSAYCDVPVMCLPDQCPVGKWNVANDKGGDFSVQVGVRVVAVS